ncbi:hypothetical protein FAM09_06935 [Niastella caeni]|uniref:CBU-0592-like domain-containing protein n=1 Tax=Niastella caeni TaxID=2569763 RepID=A0A4S8I246_9BACT|nr:hypothetical protein [Niastella caeni]THU41831.1 hypothetical protein FAM09_06935 [Niastella caeni]
MHLTFNDWIGFIGVFILLLAYLMNLAGKLSKDGLLYIGLNIVGAGLACLASWLIHYLPFVLLEGTWTLVSLGALIRHFRTK